MSSRLTVAIAAPLLTLVVGGALGFATRPDAGTSSAQRARGSTGATLPDADSLDSAAPRQPLPAPRNPMVIDATAIIGSEVTDGASIVDLPAGAAVALSVTGASPPIAVDSTTGQPVPVGDPTSIGRGEPTPLDAAPTLEATIATIAPAAVDSSTTVPADELAFVDPCSTTTDGCGGAPATVRDGLPDDTGDRIDPLTVSVPVPAASGFANQCSRIEGDVVPDPLRPAALRPTIAVVVNQPASIAISGTWSDGATFEKATMITSPAHDAEWQRAFDERGEQRSILACLTLPLDVVRPRARTGDALPTALLTIDVLAISASGRASSRGQVALTVAEGVDPLYRDPLTFTSMGERRGLDDVLRPTVGVHFAFANDEVTSAPGATASSVRVDAYLAFVENADCAGWSVNDLGVEQTASSRATVQVEQRTISGRQRPVTVVDAEMRLDPTLPAGWQGVLCLQLTAVDAAGRRTVIDVRGAEVRGPRTPRYDVGVLLDDPELPAERLINVTWETRSGVPLCMPAVIANDGGPAGTQARGASCGPPARLAPDGIVVTLWLDDAAATTPRPFRITVPVNSAYCNPDDPYAWVADGCDRGTDLRMRFPLDDDSSTTVKVMVRRTADAGVMLGPAPDPAQAWKIGTINTFAF